MFFKNSVEFRHHFGRNEAVGDAVIAVPLVLAEFMISEELKIRMGSVEAAEIIGKALGAGVNSVDNGNADMYLPTARKEKLDILLCLFKRSADPLDMLLVVKMLEVDNQVIDILRKLGQMNA